MFQYSSAAELEDFSGGITNTRVTINPASVALIRRFHLQYNTFSSEESDTTGKLLISAPKYDEGIIQQGRLSTVVPFSFFALGYTVEEQNEKFRNKTTLPTRTTSIINETTNQRTQSITVGVSLPFLAFGMRYNLQSYSAEVKESGDASMTIKGESKIVTNDFGLILPNLLPDFDIAFTFIPEKSNRINLKVKRENSSSSLGSLNSKQNVTIEEAQKMIFGFGYLWNLGPLGSQILMEYGQIAKVDANLKGHSNEGGSVIGGLYRILWPPILDITYGVQVEEIEELRTILTSTSIQFPFLFDGQVIKFGVRNLQIFDGSEQIESVTFPQFSFNLQFGEPVPRALDIEPKTKELTLIDRSL